MDGTSARAALGLSPGASRHEVKQAYRTLALRAHPDRGGDSAWFDYLTRTYEHALCDSLALRRRHPFLDRATLAPAMAAAPPRRTKNRDVSVRRSFAQELELALAT